MTFPADTGERLGVTVSVGVACEEGAATADPAALIAAADHAAYAAGAAGRNCVRAFTPGGEPARPRAG